MGKGARGRRIPEEPGILSELVLNLVLKSLESRDNHGWKAGGRGESRRMLGVVKHRNRVF